MSQWREYPIQTLQPLWMSSVGVSPSENRLRHDSVSFRLALIQMKSEASRSHGDPALRRSEGVGVHAIPPGTRFRGHEHDTVHLCAVLRGAFRERIASGETTLCTGSLRVSPAARHHIDFGPDGADCLIIEIHNDELAGAITRRYHRSTLFEDRALFALARSMAAELADFTPTTPLILECHLAEVVAQIDRRARRRSALVPPSWLRAARDHLVEAPHDVSLAAIARDRDVHIVHLARAFRDHFGLTVGSFVRRRRLIAASALMSDPHLPLSQVAHQAGFADQSHMTREFKHRFGTTPARWRNEVVSKPRAR